MARGGPSISVKMILTTTLLIVVTVVGSGVLNVINVRRAFDDSAAHQIDVFRKSRVMIGELGTPLFARAVEPMLLEHGRDVEMQQVVQSTVANDTRDSVEGKRDYGLKLAFVLDPNRSVVAQCVEGAQLQCKTTPSHDPIDPLGSP